MLWAPLAFLLAIGAIVARRPGVFFRPELWAEDGAVWFQAAYSAGWWRPLLQPHTGYLQEFPRLVAGAGLAVPLAALPMLFAAVAVVVQALPAGLLVSERFAEVVPRRAVRLLLAAVYIAVPNSFEVDGNLTNAQWHLALLAFMCLVATPAGWPWRVFDVVVTVLSGLTGPFVLVLAVIAVVWVPLRRRRWSALLGSLSLSLAVVQGVSLLRSPRGHYAPLGASLHRLVLIVGGQVALGALVGSQGLKAMVADGDRWGFALAGLVVLVVTWALALAFGPLVLRLFVAMAATILAASLASPVASVTMPQWQALTIPTVGSRYWFIPMLAFLTSLVWLVSWARPRPLALVALAGLAIAASVGMPADWRYPALPAIGYRAGVARFDRAPRGTQVAIPIDPPGWKMVLTKR